MNMVMKVAIANTAYHKSKNILTGIAVFLTTLLLFLVPTIGYNIIQSQFVAINKLYPNWHALYRNVSQEMVEKLSVHHTVQRWGLRSDVGFIVAENADIAMIYLEEEGFSMYQMKLLEGHLPKKENEIVVSKGILEELSKEGTIGDTITIPYQIYRDGGLDYIQEREFQICGLIADTKASLEQKAYSVFVSKAFLEAEIEAEQISYRFLFQVGTEDVKTTEQIEEKIYKLASQFEIPEQEIGVNKDYLGANYVDPAYLPAIIMIMLIIVVAGVITIYSIYYVSMGERIQEFGKMKAIGATKKQLRHIVLWEGLMVAGVAIPCGLLLGTVLTKGIFLGMLSLYQKENEMMQMTKKLIVDGTVPLYHWWIYLLSAFVAVVTVYLSMLRPMKVASKVSAIEAMRYQNGIFSNIKSRKGYQTITVFRLTKRYLAGNKKKSIITICSMAITGLFFMIVATVLSCANPMESANHSIASEYEIFPIIEFQNKEHPELEWSEVQKNNPLTEELKKRILQIEGITEVECYKKTYVTSDAFLGEREGVIGIPEHKKEELENGIIDGMITYEELTMGDKVVIDKKLLHWWPELNIGDVLEVVIEDGDGMHKRQLEIVAIGDYPLSFTNYSYLLMAEEGIENFSEYNLNFYYRIFAKEKYNEEVEKQLNILLEESGSMHMRTWQEEYEGYQSNMAMTSGMCYAFLSILGVICIMNMINTMIHGVHVRKKEIGMLQAVGMSDRQLYQMLRLEGMFYTMGTLFLVVGGGSLAGYPVFIWAKENGIFGISQYHYPVEATILVVVVLIAVQFVLTLILGKSVKKESIINRIRFSN